MKYEIIIEEIVASTDSKYPNRERVYTQIVDNIDIKKVIDAVNSKEQE